MMMTMTDFGSHFAGSTSSDTMSGSVGSRQPRVRTIRLVRPNTGTLPPPGLTCRHGPGLGFSLRGGREHGTGFFVSSVEPGSESHRQGLRVGDQIIRVNGFTVEDAVHKEVLQLISNHTHLTLKVRSVGMIPVKDRITDPLSWQIISDYGGSARSSPPLSDKPHDVRISIMVAPRSKLGCGICKGPEWKPGIFVQFTKDGGIAREAGLRPGDQIVSCNNVDFNDIPFNEAVNIMKTSRQLDLTVRKAAGSELFPGESSGYNSSASSVTGDQSPSWSDSKRLSIVKEENLDLEDRLSQLDLRLKSKKWEKIHWDDDNNRGRHYKPTIINLSENGTTIKNNGSPNDFSGMDEIDNKSINKLTDLCLMQQQHEMKTVVVDVHRSDVEDNDKTEIVGSGRKSPSTSSFASLASRSSTASSSLTSAISQELQRRSERNKVSEQKPSIDEQLEKKKMIPTGLDSEKQTQHNKLMEEFKTAHRRMFKSPSNSSSEEAVPSETSPPACIPACKSPSKETVEKDREVNSRQRVVVDDRQQPPPPPKETLQERAMLNGGSIRGSLTSGPPPPPPPMPIGEGKALPNGIAPSPPQNSPKTVTTAKPKAPPVPIKAYSHPIPPPCPTPDYDTLSISSSTCSTLPRNMPQNTSTFRPVNNNNNIRTKNNNSSNKNTSQQNNISDTVEMESLESFKLNNPSSPRPKPPNTYFKTKSLVSPQSSNGSSTSSNSSTIMRRQQKPVSVTIGEYPTGSYRKEPGKFEFLHQGSASDEVDRANSQSVSSKFASELANTLQRSNLKRRTESMENILNDQHISSQTNGSITISVNKNLNKNLAKSTNDLSSKNMEKLGQMLANRVTINVPSSDVRKNGILKNANGNSDFCVDHRPVLHQKSITFGEITTVISDRPLHVN